MSEGDRDAASRARGWLLSRAVASLSTLCGEAPSAGWPFGSVVPFALSARGEPVLLLASIAEHTRNLRGDPRASLLVQHGLREGDPQATWRLTVLAHARPARDDEDLEDLFARYRERVPDAPGYSASHDFSFWILEPLRARWIGGFGTMGWLEGAALLREPEGEGLRESQERIISHMNADHEDAIIDMCEAASGVRPAGAQISVVDRAGFSVETRDPDGRASIGFGREIRAQEAREVFVDLTQSARARLRGGGEPPTLDTGSE